MPNVGDRLSSVPTVHRAQTGCITAIDSKKEEILSRDSSLSRKSYASHENYQDLKDHTQSMKNYVAQHPLYEMLNTRRWGNIPVPVKDLFHMICDA